MKINFTVEDLDSHIAVAAVISDNDKILMQEHVKFGFWTIPIGKVKKGQTIINGLEEELYEECGIKVESVKEIKSKEYNYLREGKNVKVCLYLFDILKYSGKLENKEPHKHTQQKFLNLDEVIELPYLSDSTVLYLQTLGINRDAKI